MKLKKRKQQPIFSTLSDLKTEKLSEPVIEKPAFENKTKREQEMTCAVPPSEKNNSLSQTEDNLHIDPFAALDFVYISPGTFLMGSPEEEFGRNDDETLHEVTLTRGFYLQTTLVTQKQWKIVMGGNPSSFSGKLDRPVDGVSWNDCQQFIKRLNSFGTYYYRLPTEAEWEYACRAGTEVAVHNVDINISEGGHVSGLDEVAWYNANSAGKTHPVAQKRPNTWGLYDMHGNLCEWCEDWYDEYPAGLLSDPINTKVTSGRVARGGCWVSTAQNCRSASRFSWSPDCRSDFVGFRLIRDKK